MTQFAYAYRNRKLGCFTQPILSPITAENTKIGTMRELLNLEDEKKKKEMADLEMCYLGTYDDETGLFDQSNGIELLLVCGDYIVPDTKA